MKNSLHNTLVGAALLLASGVATPLIAQESEPAYQFKLQREPKGFDNASFLIFWYNGDEVLNLRSFATCTTSKEIVDMKLNPTGATYAVLCERKGKREIGFYNAVNEDDRVGRLRKLGYISAMTYAPDSRRFAVATDDNKIRIFDTRTNEQIDELAIANQPEQLLISGNNYYIATSKDNELKVWNFETKAIRKEITAGAKINHFCFSDDSNMMAVLTADGNLTTYDTKTFLPLKTYGELGEGITCKFHPEGKYVAVATASNHITMVNLVDDSDRSQYACDESGINGIGFAKNSEEETFMIHNTTSKIVAESMSGISPFYGKLMKDELDERLNTWLEKMDNESLEAYGERVNDETRMEQMMLIEQDIATRMADNLIEKSEVSAGAYNPEEKVLTLDFNTMPSIYLEVPQEEAADFAETDNIEFKNALYGLTENDNFELIYADVYNKKSNKTYTFDNRERKSLDYLSSEEEFVSMELIQQSNMDKIKLEEIKEEVINLAKSENLISDNTTISVNADVELDNDANGEKITNYKINFAYDVKKEYSSIEDFKPGKYKMDASGAATSMATIIKKAFEGEFAQYVVPGKKLVVKITGNADAMPINGVIAYDGCYGEFKNEPVYKNGALTAINLTKKGGITLNEQLAFLRASGVKDFLVKEVSALSEMKTSYDYYIELLEGEGGEFRRIKVEFVFVDAF